MKIWALWYPLGSAHPLGNAPLIFHWLRNADVLAADPCGMRESAGSLGPEDREASQMKPEKGMFMRKHVFFGCRYTMIYLGYHYISGQPSDHIQEKGPIFWGWYSLRWGGCEVAMLCLFRRQLHAVWKVLSWSKCGNQTKMASWSDTEKMPRSARIAIWPLFPWEFQDPKMEVLYHIRPYFVGIFPYIDYS